MMYWLIIAGYVGIGLLLVVLVSFLSPTRLTDKEGSFRYSVALLFIFTWLAGLIALVIWCLVWPARYVAEQKVKNNAVN